MDQLDNFNILDDDSETSFLENEDFDSIVDDSVNLEYINTKDYNLNSPLTFEGIENFYDFILNGASNPVFDSQDHQFYNELIIKCPDLRISERRTLDDIVKFNSWTLSNYSVTGISHSFMNCWMKRILDTFEVPRSFLYGWLNIIPKNVSTYIERIEKVPEEEKQLLSLFLDLHLLVALLNARSKRERENLRKLLIVKTVNIDSSQPIEVISNSFFGPTILFSDYIMMPRHQIILDRNNVLALKDTSVARFNTLIYMRISDSEYKYSEDEISRLKQLYRIGDSMIYSIGNVGYQGIKLLETICNGAICKKAETYRPLFPPFESFQDHITKSVGELVNMGITHMKEIYDLIYSETSMQMLILYYSIFRHWSHPIIKVESGLIKLEELVNRDLIIDEEYANILASDLAHKILYRKYKECKKWFVDVSKLPRNHPLQEHIMMNTWPPVSKIRAFGDNWHTLPLTKCFDIPDVVDLSLIYSDKSHSIYKPEIISHILNSPSRPIPTKRVLKTLLEEPAVDWPLFLQRINDEGLYDNELAIGLKPKEREEKIDGRFFSLMTWNMRNYFVMTEYLIKTHIVPLFQGLTMADDLQKLIGKMINNTEGQGNEGYDNITISNSIDYTKWNNLQREESTKPVFTVIGQFLGYPLLIARTHEIFQKSLIYYPSRPDKMYVSGGKLHSIPGTKYCWQGQKGGLEGLRQKGWSVVSLLMIERESRSRNTKVRCLAQGDNQIISCLYKTDPWSNKHDLINNLLNIKHNNDIIMKAIRDGATKLGLIINEDETMQSIDYLNYGKIPLIRAKMIGLTAKRWSRVTCCTNDQLPSLGNLMSSVSTAALTVGHYSNNPIDAIIGYHIFGNLSLTLSLCHNPALRGDPSYYIKLSQMLQNRYFSMLILYLDPTLGGIGGTSLLRFIIRLFPDPVCEALSFWRIIGNSTIDIGLKKLALAVGSPKLATFSLEHIEKLIESPFSLNIPRGVSPSNMIKEEIKKQLHVTAEKIGNKILRDATIYYRDHEPSLLAWLSSITPLFPKFVSEFASSTYYGLSRSLLGLIINSRTLKNLFKTKFVKEIDDVILKSEVLSINSLINIVVRSDHYSGHEMMWVCSSELADQLRECSWGRPVLGMTIPHPPEMLENLPANGGECPNCINGFWKDTYVTTLAPRGLNPIQIDDPCGPYPPYLGSNTKEGTSILQPWEKESNIPLIRRATEMRRAICWFVKPGSLLANSINNNIKSLTGEDWSGHIHGFERTGSALHRFHCSRASNGGFAACSPAPLRWVIVTTDTMSNLPGNYDFMFQSSLIFSQISSICQARRDCSVYHAHISCTKCVREIKEYTFDSMWEYQPSDCSQLLKGWLPATVKEWVSKQNPEIKHSKNSLDWSVLTVEDQSFNIGSTIGFCFGDETLGRGQELNETTLFPVVIRSKLNPLCFFKGVLQGLRMAGALHLVHRRSLLLGPKSQTAVQGILYFLVEEITQSNNFIQFVSHGNMLIEVNKVPHKIPASYPLSNIDSGCLIRGYLKHMMWKYPDLLEDKPLYRPWAFADIQDIKILGSLGLATIACRIIRDGNISKLGRTRIKDLQQDYIDLMNDHITQSKIDYYISQINTCPSELRHACKMLPDWVPITIPDTKVWTVDIKGNCHPVHLGFSSSNDPYCMNILRKVNNPSISGLRLFQCATGAHYKLHMIFDHLDIRPRDILVGGDGSGGISALCLRYFPSSSIIYNSLLIADGIKYCGSHPSEPPALTAMGELTKRCINYNDVWRHPSDLAKEETWNYFLLLKKNLKLDLLIFDMELTDNDVYQRIIENLKKFVGFLLEENGTIIFKTYLKNLLVDNNLNVVHALEKNFMQVVCINNSWSSSFTSEYYVAFRTYTHKPFPQRFLSVEDKDNLWAQSFVNHPIEEEFKRCLRAFDCHRSIVGVPPHLCPDWRVDLSTLFVISGLESGISASLCNPVHSKDFSDIYAITLTGISLLNQHIFNNLGASSEKVFPTSGKLLKLIIPIIALSTILSIDYHNLDCWELLHYLYNIPSLQVSIRNTEIDKKIQTSWKFHFQGELERNEIQKAVSLRSSMSVLGQWIRVIKLGLDDQGIKQENIDKILSGSSILFKKYFPKGGIEKIWRMSNILYFMPEKSMRT
uniref:Replicase n=2 Tax=Ekpoma virus TaxID=1615798 RepID=A0A2S1ZNV5_9RHAB|nr:L protein [Ekpoma virus]